MKNTKLKQTHLESQGDHEPRHAQGGGGQGVVGGGHPQAMHCGVDAVPSEEVHCAALEGETGKNNQKMP